MTSVSSKLSRPNVFDDTADASFLCAVSWPGCVGLYLGTVGLEGEATHRRGEGAQGEADDSHRKDVQHLRQPKNGAEKGREPSRHGREEREASVEDADDQEERAIWTRAVQNTGSTKHDVWDGREMA